VTDALSEGEYGWEERIQGKSRGLSEHVARYSFARSLKGSVVLDAACGVGYGTAMLRSSGRSVVVGVDMSLDACRHAQHEYGACVVSSDVSALPFKNDTFDLAVSFETIEHIPAPEKLLGELFRICKPRGLLVLSTPNSLVYPKGNPFHLLEFDRGEIEQLIQMSGFRIVATMGQLFRFYSPLWARRALVRRFPGLRRFKRSLQRLSNGLSSRNPVNLRTSKTGEKTAWLQQTDIMKEELSSSLSRFMPTKLKGLRANHWMLAPTYFIILATKPA